MVSWLEVNLSGSYDLENVGRIYLNKSDGSGGGGKEVWIVVVKFQSGGGG